MKNVRLLILVILTTLVGGVFLSSCGKEDITPTVTPSPTIENTPTPSPVDDVLEGDRLFHASDLSGALEAYQRALDIDDSYSPAHVGLSHVYYWVSKYEEALTHAQKAVDLSPEKAEPYIALSQAQRVLYQSQAAIESAEKAVSLESDLVQAQTMLSLAYLYDHQYEEAEEYIFNAHDLAPDSPYVNRGLGHYYEQTADYHRAHEAFQRAVENEPAFFGWYLNVGQIYLLQDHFDQSIDYFERALDLAPEQLLPLLGLARAKISQRDFVSAQSYIDEALSLGLEDDELHESQGDLYVAHEEFGKAIDAFNQVLEDSPDDFEARFGVAFANFHQEDCDQAKSKFTELVEDFPRSIRAKMGRGFAEICDNNPEKALTYFRDAVELDPYSYQVQLGFGHAYMLQNRWEDAKEAYIKALQLSPSEASIHDALGYFSLYLNAFEDAEKEYEIVLEHNPYFIDVYPDLAQVYLAKEEYEEALDVAQRAVEIDPEHQDSQMYLAISKYFKGDTEEAIQILERIMEDETADPVCYLYLGLAYRDLGDYRQAKDEIEIYRKLRANELTESEDQRLEMLISFLDIGYLISEDKAIADMEEYFSYIWDPIPDIKIQDIKEEGRTLTVTIPITSSDLEDGNAIFYMYVVASVSSFIGPRIDPPISNGLLMELDIRGETQFVGELSLGDIRQFGDTLLSEEQFISKIETSKILTYQTTPFWNIKQRVHELRELTAPDPVNYEYVTADEFEDLWDSSMDERQQNLMDTTDALLTMLGLIPSSMSLEDTLEELYTDQVAGYYLLGKDTLYIIQKDDASFEDEVTIAHEYVHALQDQIFDLKGVNQQELNSDQSLAKDALIEGDATFTSLLYRSENISLMDELEAVSKQAGLEDETLDDMPYYIRNLFEFPYLAGLEFVNALYERGGWEEVNQAYESVPQSTEQILHPYRYWEGDEPVRLQISFEGSASEGEWDLLERDVMGEFGLWLILAEHLGPFAGAVGAEGWGGDSYLLLHDPEADQHVWILKTYWDDQEEADEFRHLFQRCMDHRLAYKAVVEQLIGEVDYWWWESENTAVMINQNDQWVTIIFGPDRDIVDQMASDFVEN